MIAAICISKFKEGFIVKLDDVGAVCACTETIPACKSSCAAAGFVAATITLPSLVARYSWALITSRPSLSLATRFSTRYNTRMMWLGSQWLTSKYSISSRAFASPSQFNPSRMLRICADDNPSSTSSTVDILLTRICNVSWLSKSSSSRSKSHCGTVNMPFPVIVVFQTSKMRSCDELICCRARECSLFN